MLAVEQEFAGHHYSYSEAELIAHFKAIAASVTIPFFAYNNPHTSGNAISPKALAELAASGVAGVKDSAFDLVNFYNYLVKVKDPGFTFMIGTEAVAAGAVMAGAKGVVSGLANVWPELMRGLWQALQSKDYDRASILSVEGHRVARSPEDSGNDTDLLRGAEDARGRMRVGAEAALSATERKHPGEGAGGIRAPGAAGMSRRGRGARTA